MNRSEIENHVGPVNWSRTYPNLEKARSNMRRYVLPLMNKRSYQLVLEPNYTENPETKEVTVFFQYEFKKEKL